MRKLLKIFLIAVLWLGTFFWTRTVWDNYSADAHYEKSQHQIDSGDYYEALESINSALTLNPYEPNYYRGRARINVISLSVVQEEFIPEIKKEIQDDLIHAYILNPDNLVTMRNLVPLYYFIATKDITVREDSANLDPEYLENTKSFIQRLKDRFVNDAGVYVLVARYEKRLGLTKEFGDSVKRINVLRPDLLDWYQF